MVQTINLLESKINKKFLILNITFNKLLKLNICKLRKDKKNILELITRIKKNDWNLLNLNVLTLKILKKEIRIKILKNIFLFFFP